MNSALLSTASTSAVVAARQELQRLLDALRRVEQPFARRIFAELREQLPDDLLHPRILSRAVRLPAGVRARSRRRTIPTRCTRSATNLASARQAADIWAQRLQANPKDFEAAWKLARARYWLGGHAAEAERKALPRGRHRRRRAPRSQLQPNRPEGHFWIAANMGALAESFGLRQGLKYRGDIKDELLTVLRLDPAFQQGSADRALGRWYYKVPGLFGGSKKKSEEHLRKSLTYNPNSTASRFFLAETLLDMDRKDEAIARAAAA